MIIPGWAISLVTFPGVIVHEWAHKKSCELTGVKVQKVVYFRLGNPAGYVIHADPQNFKQTFWISTGPLVVNTLLTLLLGMIFAELNIQGYGGSILLWLAVSIGMHSFPSDTDVKHIWRAATNELKKGGSLLHVLAFPFVILIFIANKLRFFWFDFFYAIGLLYLAGVSLQ